MSYSRLDTPRPGDHHPNPSSSTMGSFFKATNDTSSRTPISSTRRRKLILSYAPDWILTLALAALFFSLDKVEGYRRQFSLSDTTIHFPFAEHERVPDIALYFIAGVAPFCIMPIVNFITVRSLWDFHNAALGLILGLSLTGSFTQVVKITVGRPRPDLLSRCKPAPGLSDPPYGLSDWTICTQTDNALLRDGFRSFFSGHSSLSFAGLGFLAFYLAGKLHLFDSRGHTAKAWLSLSPFMAASLVAISRTMDYRHHWQDVLVGSLVGTVLSYFSYRQYYPSLTSPLSHHPYSPRIARDDEQGSILPTHHVVQPSSRPFGHTQGGLSVSEGTSLTAGGRPTYHSNQSSVDGTEVFGHEDYELAGTVPRPGPQHLTDAWRDRDLVEPHHDAVRIVSASRPSSIEVGRPAQASGHQ